MAVGRVIALIVPYPPLTGNHQYGHAPGGRKYLLPAVKAWRKEVWAIALQAGAVGVLKGKKFQAEYACYPPPRARPDGGNLEKVISDALQHAKVVTNDGRIKRCTWEVFDNGPNPRIEIWIAPR